MTQQQANQQNSQHMQTQQQCKGHILNMQMARLLLLCQPTELCDTTNVHVCIHTHTMQGHAGAAAAAS
jgi:hypothetical protein